MLNFEINRLDSVRIDCAQTKSWMGFVTIHSTVNSIQFGVETRWFCLYHYHHRWPESKGAHLRSLSHRFKSHSNCFVLVNLIVSLAFTIHVWLILMYPANKLNDPFFVLINIVLYSPVLNDDQLKVVITVLWSSLR